jgi:hypothetical protein
MARGDMLALRGKNGASKSTRVPILFRPPVRTFTKPR